MSDKILVSACLLGEPCRWHGRPVSFSAAVLEFMQNCPCAELIPVCPELLGGLSVPRPPCKRIGGRVFETCADKSRRREVTGPERTAEFVAGAWLVLDIARRWGCRRAILCRYSPSCDPAGITGRLLLENGIDVWDAF